MQQFYKQGNFNAYWPPRWSFSTALSRSKLPQVVSLIPILGYAVLWSDSFRQQLMRFDGLGTGLWLDPIERIELLYFGSVLVLAGLLLLYLFCPRQVRTFESATDYMEGVFKALNIHELELVHARLAPLFTSVDQEASPPFLGAVDVRHIKKGLEMIQDDDHRRSTLMLAGTRQSHARAPLKAHFLILDRSQPILAGLAFLLLTAGAFVFLVPSLEVFLMVVSRAIFGHATPTVNG
ncbi:hypothetical protein JNB71_03360 [Rhizobium herbae]|uniref:Uncharacterized protein n=1 Tax=Rhizobium herbae TaxID=508661 RepID=A0ABS7H539_9HYPH|nr:hypothetical protein [Rhizobium herbae]MBW9062349.1 hypothetical protein [Rhizobium herbae]